MKPFTQRMAESAFSAYSLPPVDLSRLPTIQERHAYESAQDLIDRLAARYAQWVKELAENVQPVMYAILANGAVIRVVSLSREGHNGVAIEGLLEDANVSCLIITHQASLQIFCAAEVIANQSERRTIWFHSGRAGDPTASSRSSMTK